MTNSKIDRIEKEMQKTREKITEYQNRLKELAMQKTEAENLQIIALVRSMRLTPQSLPPCFPANRSPALPPQVQTTWNRRKSKMKNKGFFKTAAALLAALVLLGGFSVTAYAGGGEDIPTNDSGVIVETEPRPLTPDGNLSLIDDIEGEAAEDKQFIIVQSKNGNYFYIIVDRAAEGENTVHFLNQVDEADLMALMEDGSGKAQAPAVCTCKDKCKAGAVNTACPVCSVNMTECAGKEAVPEPDDAPPEKEKSNAGGLVIFLVVTLLGGGGAFYYFKIMKPKQGIKGDTDLDDFDFDEYDEDEPEADDLTADEADDDEV